MRDEGTALQRRGQVTPLSCIVFGTLANSILDLWKKNYKLAIEGLEKEDEMFRLIPFCCVTLGHLLNLSVHLFPYL